MKGWKPRELFWFSLFLFFGSPVLFAWVAATSDDVPFKAYVVLCLGPVAGAIGFYRSLSMPAPAPTTGCSYCTLAIKPEERTVCAACRVVIHKECRDGHERVYHAGPDPPEMQSAYRD